MKDSEQLLEVEVEFIQKSQTVKQTASELKVAIN